MNRLLEMEKDLEVLRKKQKQKRKIVLSSATALRQTIRPRYSHEMAIFKHNGLDDDDKNVWLQVLIGSETHSISRLTRVKDVTKKGDREHFTIVDWPFEGKAASVKEQKSKSSRFKEVSYEDVGGIITYSISKKELLYGSNTSSIKTYMSEPLPKGEYKILLPD